MSKRYLIAIPIFLVLGIVLMWNNGRLQAIPTEPVSPNAPDWGENNPTLISTNAGASSDDRPYISFMSAGKGVIVFNRQLTGITNKDPYFSISINNGDSWSPPAPIFNSPGTNSNSLQVNGTIDDNGISHAVWVEELGGDTPIQRIYYLRENNWNNGSSTPIQLDQSDPFFAVSSPQIVAYGNRLDAVWTKNVNGDREIFHARSTDNGVTWSGTNPIVPIDVAPGISDSPSLAVDSNGNLHVAWSQANPNGKLDPFLIAYARGTGAGATVTWSDSTFIGDLTDFGQAGADLDAQRPSIIANGINIQVAFTGFDRAGGGQTEASQWVYYITCNASCTNSESWSNPLNIVGEAVTVSDNSPKYIVPSLLHARGCAYVYFHGISGIFSEDNELIEGVNGCDLWSGAVRDTATLPQQQSIHASIDYNDSAMHLVFEQRESDGDRRVYYIQGGLPPQGVYMPFVTRP